MANMKGLDGDGLPIYLKATGAGTIGDPHILERTITGVATEATLDARTGALTETAPASDTASSGLNGRLQRIAQRLTSLIALLPTALGTGGGLKVDGSGTALPVSDLDPEISLASGMTSLRDKTVAQRYTVLADSVADGLATFWSSTVASGGTNTVTGGEGLIQTSANATGSAQLVSTTPAYYPGQVTWFNSAIRLGDTGSAGNIRRWGVFTVSGTTPQDGFYYELTGTTFNAVVVKAGTPTAVAVASWSRVAAAPFTLDTNYHSFEIRWTANSVHFLIDNVVRHVVSGTTTTITATLNFPMAIHSVNSSGATNRLIAVRNCGIGRFGTPDAVLGMGYASAVSVTRPSNTNTYQANDVVGAAAAAITFANATGGPGEYLITSVSFERDVTALISGETSYVLHLYNVTPPSALADEATFDLPSGDRNAYLGSISLGTPVDLGSTLYVEQNSVNKQITALSSSLFGYLVTVGSYAAASASVHKIVLHTVKV